MDASFCRAPFFTVEVFGDGNVYCCCPAYSRLGAIGNIYTQDWQEIKKNPLLLDLRRRLQNNDYSYCYRNYCSARFFPLNHELHYVDRNQLDITEGKTRIFKLSMDPSCNVACSICRKKIFCNDFKTTAFLNSKVTKILPILKEAEIVNFTGVGDPFASKHVRKFTKLIAETYPHMRFNFHTNGILCDEKNLTNLEVIDRLSVIEVSLHSATEETYNKIVKNGDWNRVNANLAFLSNLVKVGKLDELQLNFVVTSENYGEIPDFVNLCCTYGAKAFFWNYRQGDGVYDYDSINVAYPLHEKHRDFVRVMSRLGATKGNNVFMSPLLEKFTKIADIEEYLFYASIFSCQNLERYESREGVFKDKFIRFSQVRRTVDKLCETDLERARELEQLSSKVEYLQRLSNEMIQSISENQKKSRIRKLFTLVQRKLSK